MTRTDMNAAVIEAAISSGRMSSGPAPRSLAIDLTRTGSNWLWRARIPISSAESRS